MSADVALRHMQDVHRFKYGNPPDRGWTPRLRDRFGYSSPDDWYEAMLFHLVGPETVWLDVGCGRNIFPFNPAGASHLAKRCRHLVGIDPSDNVLDNPFVHERAQCLLQEYRSDTVFDLITMRMVAEHVDEPAAAMDALSRLVRPGGRVVVYTVAKFSPVSVVSALTPLSMHHVAKRFLWGAEERDTFPVAYKMNTRHTLRTLFQGAGFAEEAFFYLDDCRSFGRWKVLAALELTLWKGLRRIGLRYPEACLLGIYVKT